MKARYRTAIEARIAAIAAAIAPMADSKTWFIALSGGADSTALLHLLAGQAGHYGAEICALIVNHNLRQEAGAEAELVARQVRSYGIAAEILTVTEQPPSAARQEWARHQRYQLLCAYARANGGVLWLAHHYDDQAETVAMRLAHDSGLKGLGAMRYISSRGHVPLLRPLLAVPKSELVAYCAAHQLSFVEDPSNENSAFERVRWRKLLLKEPKLADNLCALGMAAQHIEANMEKHLAAFWRNHVEIRQAEFTITCEMRPFFGLPAQAQMRLMRQMLSLVGTRGYPAAIASVQQLLSRLKQGRSATLAACLIKAEGEKILILPEAGRALAPVHLSAGHEIFWGNHLLVRCASWQDALAKQHEKVRLSPMSEAAFARMPKQNPYRIYLSQFRPEIRMIFPLIHALDDSPITPHINDMMQMGQFGQVKRPSAQLAIVPVSQLANKVPSILGDRDHR